MLHKTLLASTFLLYQVISNNAEEGNPFLAASKGEYWYSEAININYDVTKIPSADYDKTKMWIGLYSEYPEAGPYYYEDALWTGLCGTQESYYEGCDAVPTKGSIKFYAEDPDHDSYSEFPIAAGNWHACLWTEDYYMVGACAEFKVKPLPKAVLRDASIGPYSINPKTMTLSVEWETPIPIVKQWIGVVPAEDIIDGVLPYVNATYPWLYAACNNQMGNQEENNDCSLRKQSGTVTFNSDTIDRYEDTVWPPYKGNYKICLVTHYEPPYTPNTYKCMDNVLKVPDLYKD